MESSFPVELSIPLVDEFLNKVRTDDVKENCRFFRADEIFAIGKKRWIKSQKCALNDVTFTPLA